MSTRGPLYIFTVPCTSTRDEMREIADLVCGLPSNLVGTVIVMQVIEAEVALPPGWDPVTRVNTTESDPDASDDSLMQHLRFVPKDAGEDEMRTVAETGPGPCVVLHDDIEVSLGHPYDSEGTR